MTPLGIFQHPPGGGGTIFNITISTNQTDLNLLDYFLALNPGQNLPGNTVNFTINSGVVINRSTSVPSITRLTSMTTGIWDGGVTLTLDNNSNDVEGPGADGNGPNNGFPGGTAFLVENAITVDNAGGSFIGGGGGGAGTDQWIGQPGGGSQTYEAGGGGGAGNPAGSGFIVAGSDNNASGSSGGLTTGGSGGDFGADPNQPTSPSVIGGGGGDVGQPGQDASDVAEPGSEDNIGGLAGYSVDGVSLVTWIDMGTLVGPTNS